jgi:hypothetical protein
MATKTMKKLLLILIALPMIGFGKNIFKLELLTLNNNGYNKYY